MRNPNVGIAGAGAVGQAMAVLLDENGYNVKGISSRSSGSAEEAAGRVSDVELVTTENASLSRVADLILITTPDDQIQRVSEEIVNEGNEVDSLCLLHMSGALRSRVLAGDDGVSAGSLHPIQSFADVDEAIDGIEGTYFGIEGDEDAMKLCEQLVRDLEGKSFRIDPEKKPLYHAAACISSNYLVTLVRMSLKLYREAGIPGDRGKQALIPLLEGTLENIEELGASEALTGPIVRGDRETVDEHLRRMKTDAPDVQDVYRALGEITAEMAYESSSSSGEQTLNDFRKLFSENKEQQ